jgi:hypothetical protein
LCVELLFSELDRSGTPHRFCLHLNLHSPERRLIELRMAHADLNALIDRSSLRVPLDELTMRRLKKQRLALRDELARLESALDPQEPA